MATVTIMLTANPKARVGTPRRMTCPSLADGRGQAAYLIMAAVADGWELLTDDGAVTRLGNGARRLDIAVREG